MEPGRRLYYYIGFFVVFAWVYGVLTLVLNRFPDWLLFGILVVSLGKDLVDEVRMRSGGDPVAYARIEHNPSNVVLLFFLATGFVEPVGEVLSVPLLWVAYGLAVVDLVLDGSQDFRRWR